MISTWVVITTVCRKFLVENLQDVTFMDPSYLVGPSWDENLPAKDLGSARAAEQPEPEAGQGGSSGVGVGERKNPAEIGDELLWGVIIFLLFFFLRRFDCCDCCATN